MQDELRLLARLPSGDSQQLAAIYDWPAIDCLAQGSWLWLRLTGPAEQLELLLARLPSATVFQMDSTGRIVPTGQQVPEAECPEGNWLPLRSQVRLQLPTAQYAPTSAVSLPLKVQASSHPRDINLILSTLNQLQTAVTNNYRNRFETLEFATAQDSQVLVRGPHCTLVPGTWFHLTDGIAVQAGYRIVPDVAESAIAAALNLETDQILLCFGNGTQICCRRIEFVQVQRSALLQTLERFA